MTDKITKLENAMYEANGELERAQNKARAAADAVAAAYAESLGLQVGTVVVVKKTSGWGNSKVRQHRLRVTEFKYRGYGNPPLALFGRTIRKDGTDGDRHEIYQDWEIEKAAE